MKTYSPLLRILLIAFLSTSWIQSKCQSDSDTVATVQPLNSAFNPDYQLKFDHPKKIVFLNNQNRECRTLFGNCREKLSFAQGQLVDSQNALKEEEEKSAKVQSHLDNQYEINDDLQIDLDAANDKISSVKLTRTLCLVILPPVFFSVGIYAGTKIALR